MTRVFTAISDKALQLVAPKAEVNACGCAYDWTDCFWANGAWFKRYYHQDCHCRVTYTEVCVPHC